MKFSITIALFFSYFLCFSTDDIKSLEDDFLIFDEELNLYVPLVDPINTQKNISFFLSKSDISTTLKIISGTDLSIFLDNKFYANIPKGDTFVIPVNQFLKQSQGFVTISSLEKLSNSSIFCYNGNKYKKTEAVKESIFSFSDILKLKKNANQKYIIGLIFCILCFVLAKMFFPEVLVNVFPANSSNNNRSYGQTSSKIQLHQNEVIVQLSLVATLLLIGSWVFLDKQYMNYVQNPTLNAVFSLAFFFIILLLIKIVLHLLFNTIFKTALLSKTLVIEHAYLILFFVLILVPFLFLLFSPYFNLNFLNSKMLLTFKLLLFILLFAREIYVSYKIIGFRKKYLFAYICICDIFPFIYLLKITQDFSIL
ncbi:MAG: DUF4271 domain-containing protein [Bacteroidetes bacterium]|nr:MAG: DUF4271 domain-containing protein [Bacteroidota bacterium]